MTEMTYISTDKDGNQIGPRIYVNEFGYNLIIDLANLDKGELKIFHFGSPDLGYAIAKIFKLEK